MSVLNRRKDTPVLVKKKCFKWRAFPFFHPFPVLIFTCLFFQLLACISPQPQTTTPLLGSTYSWFIFFLMTSSLTSPSLLVFLLLLTVSGMFSVVLTLSHCWQIFLSFSLFLTNVLSFVSGIVFSLFLPLFQWRQQDVDHSAFFPLDLRFFRTEKSQISDRKMI